MTTTLTGVAVITGASGGIGRAVARALASCGMCVLLTGRDSARLQGVIREIGPRPTQVLAYVADLSTDAGIHGLVEHVAAGPRRLDVLVHAAGALRLGNIESAEWDDLDAQYRVNLRAPYLLTKAFLPMLRESSGQVVFVNSTAALAAGADNGPYAATKHGLRSLTGSIRDHVNQHGIRVLSVYPGRTAGPMQESMHRSEGKQYVPTDLVQPGDVAEMIVAALALPRTAEVTDITLRPMKKPS